MACAQEIHHRRDQQKVHNWFWCRRAYSELREQTNVICSLTGGGMKTSTGGERPEEQSLATWSCFDISDVHHAVGSIIATVHCGVRRIDALRRQSESERRAVPCCVVPCRAVSCRAVRYWSGRAVLSSSYAVLAFYRRL